MVAQALNDNAQQLLEKRYLQEDDYCWEDICHRVAGHVGQDRNSIGLYYDVMSGLDFVPSTPCLVNAGVGNGQLSSCFILDIDDSIEDIMSTVGECAKVFQSGGGAGFNISKLRPKGDKVHTAGGYSSGPVSFMELFNTLVDVVKQGNAQGRKGAIKIDLNAHHPDIFEFVDCKKDTSNLNNMNISVSCSDEFMNAVLNDEYWTLEFNGVVYEEVRAKDLWKKIVENAWATGEPGVSFRSNMERGNVNNHIGEITGSNPCLHKDTYMMTNRGLEKISKIDSSLFWNGQEYELGKAWKTDFKKVIKLKTNSGFEFIVTPSHKFKTSFDEWLEAKDLLDQRIKIDINEKDWEGYNPYPNVNYRVLGFEFGDASYHKASNRMKYLYFGQKDKEVEELVEDEFGVESYTNHNGSKMINIPFGTVYADSFEGSLQERMIPDWIMQLPKQEMSDFLCGLFSANGSNLSEYGKIQLVSVNKDMLQQVRQMLMLFGIKAKLWFHQKENDVEFYNGTYTCKKSYHLVISRKSYNKFFDKIGFIQSYKNQTDYKAVKKEEDYEVVKEIEELEEKVEVWDFTTYKSHQGIAAGAVVHNCAEYVNIPYSSCNLGSINLEKCLKGNYKIYWDKLANLVDIGIRFISDMIDVNNLPLREIEATTNQIRSAGLGTMGYANMLYKLNIPYGSKEAAELTDKLYSYIYEQALATNKSLAEEKGVYPAWRGSKWEQQGIEVNLSDMLSIAPNGSIAFLAGTTGGIEPEFALVYERETSEGDIYYNVNKVFEERLRSEGLYTEELMKKVANNNGSCQGIDEIPQHIQDVFVTANDLSHLDHVKAIEPIAKHVDLSIAKTVNLPVDSTPSDIGETYMTAWKSGIKGITVYRQGSREGVLRASGSSTKLNRGEIIEPLERAPAERIRLKTACGTLWFIPVFDEDGNIIEIFTETKSGGCKSSIEALSRQCSLALRSGAPVSEVIDQLLSADACTAYTRAKESRELSDGHSCPSAMALKLRELSQGGVYNNEQEAVCPACDAPLNFSEGCLTCRKCGWSKCN